MSLNELKNKTEVDLVQVVAEIWDHSVPPPTVVYPCSLNNSYVANGSILLFHFILGSVI